MPFIAASDLTSLLVLNTDSGHCQVIPLPVATNDSIFAPIRKALAENGVDPASVVRMVVPLLEENKKLNSKSNMANLLTKQCRFPPRSVQVVDPDYCFLLGCLDELVFKGWELKEGAVVKIIKMTSKTMQCFELGRGDGGVFFVSTLHELATSESTENELDSFLDSCFDSETTPPTILALNRRNAWKNRERQMARVRKKLKMLGIGKIGLVDVGQKILEGCLVKTKESVGNFSPPILQEFFDKKIQICAGNETYAVDSFLKPVPFRTELEVETKGSRFLQVFLEPDSEAIKIKCPVAEVIQLNLELTSEFNLRIWSNVVVSALNPLPNFYPRFYLGQTVCKVSTWKAGKETFATIGGEFEFENGLVFATSGETRLKTDEKVDGIFVSDLLSLMDKKYSELDSNLASEFVATKDDKFLIQIKLGNSTRFLTPKNAFVLFLKQLKKLAELDSEDPITFVEMMVPNNLVLSQLAAILEASRLAGLRIVFSSFN